MALNIGNNYHCNDTVFFEYFNEDQECSPVIIRNAIRQILRDYPDHYIYVGVTENPCGRFSGIYTVPALPSNIQLEVRLSITDAFLLNERAHEEDYEKMFVICYTASEDTIYDIERDAIAIAEQMSEERTLNGTVGGNGNIKPGKDYYFLYVCITRTIPLGD